MTNATQYQTVSELNQQLHQQFEQNPNLHTVYLTGEISNYRLRTGSQYFVLKDAYSTISAIMFPSVFKQLKCDLEDGLKVLVVGKVTTYVPYGTYQIQVQRLEPTGIGQLAQKLRKIQAQLYRDGLYDDAHKLALPRYPRKIGVITSPSGAVIRDILTTVHRRFPLTQVILYPAVVQGINSAADLLRQLKRLEARDDIDTIIIGRGGGSIEDLWSFNDVALAQAVYHAKIPIISSVGHETDYTILDHVADKRAATPTAAAELAVPDQNDLLATLNDFDRQLVQGLQNKIKHGQSDLTKLVKNQVFVNPMTLWQRPLTNVIQLQNQLVNSFKLTLSQQQRQLQSLEYQLLKHSPEKQLAFNQTRFSQLYQQLITVYRQRLTRISQRGLALTTQLAALDPTKIMQTGYSYVTKNQQVLKSVHQVQLGDKLQLNLADGQLLVQVLKQRKDD